jgi:hypothetical protein
MGNEVSLIDTEFAPGLSRGSVSTMIDGSCEQQPLGFGPINPFGPGWRERYDVAGC